uniref:Uncharacterized protein n=1 Tax=viral metagenome TaxID=1070528 RepID=A0A6C0CC95_9ZZZZ
MESEIQRKTIAQIISFTGYADVVCVCIGAKTDDQQFWPIIQKISKRYRLVIKIVLINSNVSKLSSIMMSNSYNMSEIFVLTCKYTIFYHNFSFGFSSESSDKLFLSLLFQLKRKKEIHPYKTNLLFIQDFTGYELETLRKCIIAEGEFKKILKNIVIGFYDDMPLESYPLLYINESRLEIFLPEIVSDAELAYYFMSADNNTQLQYHMLDQVQKRIVVTHQYLIPEWLDAFVFLSKLTKDKPSAQNFFMLVCDIDLQMIGNDIYRHRMMRYVTASLIMEIRKKLKFLSSLGFLEAAMKDFYEFCKSTVIYLQLCYEVQNKMIVCCNNIVRKLWRTNLNVQLVEVTFPIVIQKILSEFAWIY